MLLVFHANSFNFAKSKKVLGIDALGKIQKDLHEKPKEKRKDEVKERTEEESEAGDESSNTIIHNNELCFPNQHREQL